MEEISKKPRRPDFVGNIRVSLWDNGDYASLHIGDMKIRLNKNEPRLDDVVEEPKVTMEEI